MALFSAFAFYTIICITSSEEIKEALSEELFPHHEFECPAADSNDYVYQTTFSFLGDLGVGFVHAELDRIYFEYYFPDSHWVAFAAADQTIIGDKDSCSSCYYNHYDQHKDIEAISKSNIYPQCIEECLDESIFVATANYDEQNINNWTMIEFQIQPQISTKLKQKMYRIPPYDEILEIWGDEIYPYRENAHFEADLYRMDDKNYVHAKFWRKYDESNIWDPFVSSPDGLGLEYDDSLCFLSIASYHGGEYPFYVDTENFSNIHCFKLKDIKFDCGQDWSWMGLTEQEMEQEGDNQYFTKSFTTNKPQIYIPTPSPISFNDSAEMEQELQDGYNHNKTNRLLLRYYQNDHKYVRNNYFKASNIHWYNQLNDMDDFYDETPTQIVDFQEVQRPDGFNDFWESIAADPKGTGPKIIYDDDNNKIYMKLLSDPVNRPIDWDTLVHDFNSDTEYKLPEQFLRAVGHLRRQTMNYILTTITEPLGFGFESFAKAKACWQDYGSRDATSDLDFTNMNLKQMLNIVPLFVAFYNEFKAIYGSTSDKAMDMNYYVLSPISMKCFSLIEQAPKKKTNYFRRMMDLFQLRKFRPMFTEKQEWSEADGRWTFQVNEIFVLGNYRGTKRDSMQTIEKVITFNMIEEDIFPQHHVSKQDRLEMMLRSATLFYTVMDLFSKKTIGFTNNLMIFLCTLRMITARNSPEAYVSNQALQHFGMGLERINEFDVDDYFISFLDNFRFIAEWNHVAQQEKERHGPGFIHFKVKIWVDFIDKISKYADRLQGALNQTPIRMHFGPGTLDYFFEFAKWWRNKVRGKVNLQKYFVSKITPDRLGINPYTTELAEPADISHEVLAKGYYGIDLFGNEYGWEVSNLYETLLQIHDLVRAKFLLRLTNIRAHQQLKSRNVITIIEHYIREATTYTNPTEGAQLEVKINAGFKFQNPLEGILNVPARVDEESLKYLLQQFSIQRNALEHGPQKLQQNEIANSILRAPTPVDIL